MQRGTRVGLLLVLGTLLALPSQAQDESNLGQQVTVKLSTGETLTGTLKALDAITLVLSHPVLGDIAIPRVSILPPEPPPEVELVSPWSGSLDLSLNGSRGNNQKQDFRAAVNAVRDTEHTIDTYGASYLQSTSEVEVPVPNPPPGNPNKLQKTTEETTNRFYGQARREWRLDTTKWRPFGQTSLEYDTFKDWDWRVTLAAGAGYPLLDEETQSLTGRLGLAATREVGGEDDSWTPEALLAGDYRLQLNKQQRVVAGVEVYPDLEDQGEHRSVARAQWEAEINPEDPWRLTVGVERFYDSDPGSGVSKLDVNYFVGLGYKF